MVKYCVARKYGSPVCYDISAGENERLKNIKIILLTIIIIILIIVLLYYIKYGSADTVGKNTVFKAGILIAFIVFLVWIFYQNSVVSRSKIISN